MFYIFIYMLLKPAKFETENNTNSLGLGLHHEKKHKKIYTVLYFKTFTGRYHGKFFLRAP